MSKALIGLAVILSTFLTAVLPAIGHDAWYPHLHAKDLEKMLKRGEEMKGYILFLTLAFAAFLSILAVFILKRSEEEVARRIEAERARLEKLVAGSAEAAAPLLREGRYAEAIETAVRRYSELCGVSHPEVGIGGAYAGWYSSYSYLGGYGPYGYYGYGRGGTGLSGVLYAYDELMRMLTRPIPPGPLDQNNCSGWAGSTRE